MNPDIAQGTPDIIEKTLTPEEFQEYSRIKSILENATTASEIGDANAGQFVSEMMAAHDIRRQPIGSYIDNSPEYRELVDALNGLIELQNQKITELTN